MQDYTDHTELKKNSEDLSLKVLTPDTTCSCDPFFMLGVLYDDPAISVHTPAFLQIIYKAFGTQVSLGPSTLEKRLDLFFTHLCIPLGTEKIL